MSETVDSQQAAGREVDNRSSCRLRLPASNRSRIQRTAHLCFAVFSVGMVLGLRGPTLLDLQLVSRASVQQTSALLASSSAGLILGAVVSGVVHPLVGQSLVLAVSLMMMAALELATPFCHIYWLMMAAVFLVSACACSVATVGNADLLQTWEGEGRTALQALHLSFAVGSTIAAFIAEPFLLQHPPEGGLNYTGHSGNDTDAQDVLAAASLTTSPPTKTVHIDSIKPSFKSSNCADSLLNEFGFVNSTLRSLVAEAAMYGDEDEGFPADLTGQNGNNDHSTGMSWHDYLTTSSNPVGEDGNPPLSSSFSEGGEPMPETRVYLAFVICASVVILSAAPFLIDVIRRLRRQKILGEVTEVKEEDSPLCLELLDKDNARMPRREEFTESDASRKSCSKEFTEGDASRKARDEEFTENYASRKASGKEFTGSDARRITCSKEFTESDASRETGSEESTDCERKPCNGEEFTDDDTKQNRLGDTVTDKFIRESSGEKLTDENREVNSRKPYEDPEEITKELTGDERACPGEECTSSKRESFAEETSEEPVSKEHRDDSGDDSQKPPPRLLLPLKPRLGVLLAACLFYVLYFGAEGTFPAYLPPFAVLQLGWTKSAGAVLASALWAAFAACRVLCVILATCLGPVQLLALCLTLLVAALLTFLMAALLQLDWLVWTGAVAAGAAMSGVFPSFLGWLDERLVAVTVRVSAAVLVASNLAPLLNPLILGPLMEDKRGAIWMPCVILGEVILCVLTFVLLFLYTRLHLQRKYPADGENESTRLTTTTNVSGCRRQ